MLKNFSLSGKVMENPIFAWVTADLKGYYSFNKHLIDFIMKNVYSVRESFLD